MNYSNTLKRPEQEPPELHHGTNFSGDFSDLFTAAQRRERAEAEERDRLYREANAQFRQERDAALRVREAAECRIRMAVNGFFVIAACVLGYWFHMH